MNNPLISSTSSVNARGSQVREALERETAGTRGLRGIGIEKEEDEIVDVAGGWREVDGNIVKQP